MLGYEFMYSLFLYKEFMTPFRHNRRGRQLQLRQRRAEYGRPGRKLSTPCRSCFCFYLVTSKCTFPLWGIHPNRRLMSVNFPAYCNQQVLDGGLDPAFNYATSHRIAT
jgi:hypothetical protein